MLEYVVKAAISRSSIVSHARIANYVLLAVFVLAWAPAMFLHKGKITSRLSLSLISFLLVEVVQTGPSRVKYCRSRPVEIILFCRLCE